MSNATPTSIASSDTHIGDDFANKSEEKSTRRRAHRKSRYGCLNCKKRRIKCDERKPECGNCKTRQVSCDYLRSAPTSSHTLRNNNNNAPTFSSPREPPSLAPAISIQDAELMYYWTTVTSLSLTNSSIVATYWKQNVTELALSHPYLLHLIFSFTSQHLAYSRPARRKEYLERASYHYTSALETLTPELGRIDRGNCDAVLVSVQVVCSVTWARGPKPGDFLAFGVNGRSEWLTMFRGIRTTIETTMGYDAFNRSARPGLANSKIAPLSFSGPLLAYEQPLRDLRDYITYNSVPESLDENLKALDVLVQCYRDRYGGVDSELGKAFTWLFKMSEEFLETLQKHDAVPLVIYAHFAVMMNDMEGLWFMKGWTAHVIGGIWDILEDQAKTYIRWPCSVVGWIPPT